MNGYISKNLKKLKGIHPKQIVICGMGGSGLPGEILKTFQNDFGIDAIITIWKDYDLPPEEAAGKRTADTLYIFVSFSGNTEETVSGLRAALKKRGAMIVVLTGGGELKKIAESKHVPLVTFEKGNLAPREASAIMFTGLAGILKFAGVANKNLPIPKRGKYEKAPSLMRFIDNGTPVVYTSHQLKSLAYIWKILLNETAKNPAFTNELPELDHNEIVGFEKRSSGLRAIFIEEPSDNKHIKARIKLTAELIKKLGSRAEIIKLSGKSRFERFWNGVYLGEDVAMKLASKNKVNPKVIRSIDFLKTRLKNLK